MQHNLPVVALDPRWLKESAAFNSGDAALVRSSLLLLITAFGNSVAGTLPLDETYLAREAGLDPTTWAANRAVCLNEFQEVEIDGVRRLQHPGMARVLEAVEERFGAQMEQLAASSVLAVQAVDEFQLTGDLAPVEAVAKGKTALPKNFEFSPALLQHAASVGYVKPDEQEWLLTRFKDVNKSKDKRYKDWVATARNFMSSSITIREFRENFGYNPRDNLARSGAVAVVQGARPAQGAQGAGARGFGQQRPAHQTFEAQTRNGSEAAMSEAMASVVGFRPAGEAAGRPTGFGFRRAA